MGGLEIEAVLGQGELSLELLPEWLLGPTTVIGVVVCTSLFVAVRPVLEARRPSTRRPTATERDELLADTPGLLSSLRLRIVEQSDTTAGRARAAGIASGARYVFVAERVLEECSAETCRAILAHEVGHHRTFQPAVQLDPSKSSVDSRLG